MQSIPGDALFPLRNYYEDTFLGQSSSDSNNIEHGEKLIRHRLKGIESLHEDKRCIQLIIVEEDFENIFETHIINILNSNDQLLYLNNLQRIIEQYPINQSCSFPAIQTESISTFVTLLKAKFAMNEELLVSYIEEQESRYHELVEAIRTTSFESQTEIDRSNEVMSSLRLKIDATYDVIRSGDYLETAILLESSDQLSNSAETLLLHQEIQDNKWLNVETTICSTFKQVPECSKSSFQTNYNSIAAIEDSSEKIEQGEQWFSKILESLFTTYNN